MKITKLLLLTILLSFSFASAQVETDLDALKLLKDKYAAQYKLNKAKAIKWAQANGWPVRKVYEDGTTIEIQRIDAQGKPVYFSTENLNAANTISTDEVWSGGSAGLSLDGTGITLGEWDGGAVLGTHQELTGRITQEDSPSGTSDHATHVAGTMIASGVEANAKGMSGAALLRAWDYNDDVTEMSAAASSLIVSNHSYGRICGWNSFGITWHGDASIDPDEDWKFGYYTEEDSKAYDDIAYSAPYYLIVASAGNDRGNDPLFASHPEGDGVVNGGYDTVGPAKCAKNILTVAAVEDIPSGWQQATDVVMSSFSSWGPTDDGRIKPDISANGVSLYSSSNSGNSSYTTFSGTSMASPNMSGSLGLLHQHYSNLSSGATMRAATIKGLVLHTADEAGDHPGPDYRFGWGLANVKRAAELISDVYVDQTNHTMQETVLNNNGTYSIQVTSDGSKPLRVTICWTDPSGTPVMPVTQADPTDLMLVNDLDLRITSNGTTYAPWVLDPANWSNAATTGDNFRDNVEQVYIASPAAGTYTITVNHKGTLANPQAFSLLMSGAHFSDNSLPVNLSSFVATQRFEDVLIEWATESESQNQGFELYRAIEDGAWERIADYKSHPALKGAGNSSAKHTYTFSDVHIVENAIYKYKLADVDYNGKRTFHKELTLLVQSKDKFDPNRAGALNSFKLANNYPNPFNPSTNISITLAKTGQVNLSIYNSVGQHIATLANGVMEKGVYTYKWQANSQAAGLYYYRLTTDSFSETKKMLLIK